jgi:hypothetical protein
LIEILFVIFVVKMLCQYMQSPCGVTAHPFELWRKPADVKAIIRWNENAVSATQFSMAIFAWFRGQPRLMARPAGLPKEFVGKCVDLIDRKFHMIRFPLD